MLMTAKLDGLVYNYRDTTFNVGYQLEVHNARDTYLGMVTVNDVDGTVEVLRNSGETERPNYRNFDMNDTELTKQAIIKWMGDTSNHGWVD